MIRPAHHPASHSQGKKLGGSTSNASKSVLQYARCVDVSLQQQGIAWCHHRLAALYGDNCFLMQASDVTGTIPNTSPFSKVQGPVYVNIIIALYLKVWTRVAALGAELPSLEAFKDYVNRLVCRL
jgi:hypothetical protein